VFEAFLRDKLWHLPITNIQVDLWYFIEVVWTLDSGLRVFVNQKLHGERQQPSQRTVSQLQQPGRFLIGYANDTDPSMQARCGDFIVDEMQFWYADRKTLLAFDYIARGRLSKYFSI
jgi:hypothetical protein